MVIQDTHNIVYDQMRTYYQTVHNQATVETPQRAQQLMNSHYNIALLVDYKQVVNAEMHTKSQPSPDTPGTDSDQTKLKEPATNKDQTTLSFAKDTVNNHKPVLPLQCQHSGMVCTIPAGYESDDSGDTALTAVLEPKDNNVALLTYRYQNPNPVAYPQGRT